MRCQFDYVVRNKKDLLAWSCDIWMQEFYLDRDQYHLDLPYGTGQSYYLSLHYLLCIHNLQAGHTSNAEINSLSKLASPFELASPFFNSY